MNDQETKAVVLNDDSEQNRTRIKKHRFLAALKDSLGIITSACQAAGIGRTMYYQWIKEDEEFAQAVKEVEETQIDFVEGKLLQNIRDNKEVSTLFYLKTKGKARGYTEKSEVEVSGNVQHDHDLNLDEETKNMLNQAFENLDIGLDQFNVKERNAKKPSLKKIANKIKAKRKAK